MGETPKTALAPPQATAFPEGVLEEYPKGDTGKEL
jgi:hypothetical protein